MFVYNDAEFYLTKDEQVINESKMRQFGPVVIIRALALIINNYCDPEVSSGSSPILPTG